jgi:hypothetical protein
MVATRMRFAGTGSQISYIDLNKALSLQNRALHRQKVIITVYGGFFVAQPAVDNGSSQTARCSINTAPNTWVTKRAVNRGFAIWRKMIAETLDNTEGLTSGKWNDFKIFLNNAHGTSPLLPLDVNGDNLYNANAPEWDYSTMTSANPGTAPFDLMIVGPHTASRVGLIQSWLDSRGTPSQGAGDPAHEVTTDVNLDPLNNLFDTGDIDDDRLNIINNEGDQPPYDRYDVFGSSQGSAGGGNEGRNLQRVSVSGTSTSAPVAPVYGFQAICGLLQVAITLPEPTDKWELVLDVESKGMKF